MAAMTTILNEFSDNGNSRTYTTPGHTAVKPALVIQNRKVATSPKSSLEDTVRMIYGTVDSEGLPVESKISLAATVRRPQSYVQADLDAAIALFREFVASDEFADMIATQNFIQ